LGESLSKAIIFDFDGTLVDSENAIYQCFQSITKDIAPERESFAKNILIGPPLRETASEILGIDHQDKLDKFVNLFIEMHDEKAIQHSQPYPDVANVLLTLYSNNVLMAVATNKRQVPTIKLIKYFGWLDYFELIECNDSHEIVRDKCKMIKHIKSSNKRFENAYFVGDTINDGISANLNNLRFIKVEYGYGSNQNWKNILIHKSINSITDLNKI